WLLGVYQIPEGRFKDEAAQVERGLQLAEAKRSDADSEIDWLRLTGRSKFRSEAQPGDIVIQIWRPQQTSKMPRSKVRVYSSAPLVHRQEEPTCTRFYVEAFPDSEARSISWAKFTNVWTRATDGGSAPSIICTREVSTDLAERLNALWPALSRVGRESTPSSRARQPKPVKKR